MALGLTHSALGLEHTFPPEQLQRLPLEGQLPRCPPSPTPTPQIRAFHGLRAGACRSHLAWGGRCL